MIWRLRWRHLNFFLNLVTFPVELSSHRSAAVRRITSSLRMSRSPKKPMIKESIFSPNPAVAGCAQPGMAAGLMRMICCAVGSQTAPAMS